jgi:hypothetical protein
LNGGIAPGQKPVDAAVGMTVDGPADHVLASMDNRQDFEMLLIALQTLE